MRIRSLNLEQFRSYDRLSLQFGETSKHVFVGENGSGKTNIVEAVSLLSQGRSCLRADLPDAIRFGNDFFRVRADTISDIGEERTVECVFQTSPRKATAYFIRDIRTPLLSFIGAVPSIIFLPQDLDLFTGPPAGRRSFLDSLLSQLQPDYAAMRLEYERVLKQRNALLRRISDGMASENDLDLWDGQVAEVGGRIRERRSLALARIGEHMPGELAKLGETFGAVVTEQVLQSEDLAESLRSNHSKDILLRTTTAGPHRDDWRILADSRNIGQFLSRGQQRAAFLALLFVSAGLFESIRHERPVILLDDVLSELDQAHQDALLKHLEGHQVFVTTTHPVAHVAGLTMWEVREGTVTLV